MFARQTRSRFFLTFALSLCLATTAWANIQPGSLSSGDAADFDIHGSHTSQLVVAQQDEAGHKSGNRESAGKQQEANESENPSSSANSRGRRGNRRETAANQVSRSSREFLNLFEPIVEPVSRATVEVQKEGTRVAMGVIVDSGGFVLTKQSELRSPLSVKLNNGETVPAYVYGIHEKTDLALLKVEKSNLPVGKWNQGPTPEIGAWLASASTEKQPLGIGIVGVNARKIKPARGFMGVTLNTTSDDKVFIATVSPDTPAEKAGVKEGDIVLQVEGKPVTTILKLQEIVGGHPPGDVIEMVVQRDDIKLTLNITLGNARDLNPLFERSNVQNTMGSLLSRRRDDFPLAVQHDTGLNAKECGGPVVGIDGKIVGINIARQGRVASLMLPSAVVMPIIDELKTGQLAPALVNKERIDEINRLLSEIQGTLSMAPADRKDLKARMTELSEAEQKARDDLEKALSNLEKATKEKLRVEILMGQAKDKMAEAEKRQQQLKRELEKLVTGTR